jgi:Protein of unknown function (DUF2950)
VNDEMEKSNLVVGINMTIQKLIPCTLTGSVLAVAMALLVLGSAPSSFAKSKSKSFASPAGASQALYEAVKRENEGAVQAILGAGPELTSTGDEAADRLEHERFALKYEQMHRLVREPDGSTILYIGAENWPFPIPLISKQGQWHFDSDAGTEEIRARNIGANETTAIQVCQSQSSGKATAQDAAAVNGGDPIGAFAGKLASSSSSDKVQSYQGYYYRLLREEPVGVVLVAYPADYGVSGLMSFIVVAGGTVYEKDLGPKTATLAPQIQGNPAADWNAVQ